ncbi:ArnT family glycosyltransferase [Ruminococcus flavefaciens]|uniref:Dolichyl-phosphate-mannose-protein mannosyltransferase n=1 Tax=Ruminococcus flavefaciens TaxID=1265 RepID=A0A1K1MJB7_RUMFL|nr:hypothetical protein [Ruminococcus flavefaciens]SFW23268.1 hypothetical protein SAMN02910280_1266 [Ruminococcus flavefaciens]
MKKRICHCFFITFIVVLLTGNVFFWGMQKEGFHVDELFSYEQIGNTEYTKPEFDRPDEPCLNTWHSREYYEDYLTVSSDEAYDISAFYDSASRNKAHPPLYLTLFGMYVSAFFQNNFTKWSGITFNIVFFVLTLLVLYDLSYKLLKKRRLAIFSVFLYGASIGAVSTAVFIRVYMMLTFFTISFVDLHIHLCLKKADENSSISKRLLVYLGILITLVLGSLSQYYFVVMAFFVCLLYFIILLATKRKRLIVEYIIIIITGLAVYFAIWHNFFRDLFKESRGTEALSNLADSSDYSVQLMHYLQEFNKYFLGGNFFWILIIVSILAIKYYLKNINRFSFNNDNSFELEYNTLKNKAAQPKIKKYEKESLCVIFVLLSVILYLLTITKIAPVLKFDTFKDKRYIYNVFPLMVLITVFLIYKAISKFYDSLIVKRIIAVIMIMFTISGYLGYGVDYLYKGADEQMEYLDVFSDYRVLFVSNLKYLVSNLNVYFTHNKAVYQTNVYDLKKQNIPLKEFDDDKLIVYVSNDIEGSDSVIDIVCEELNVQKKTFLFETVGRHTANVYLLCLE